MRRKHFQLSPCVLQLSQWIVVYFFHDHSCLFIHVEVEQRASCLLAQMCFAVRAGVSPAILLPLWPKCGANCEQLFTLVICTCAYELPLLFFQQSVRFLFLSWPGVSKILFFVLHTCFSECPDNCRNEEKKFLGTSLPPPTPLVG